MVEMNYMDTEMGTPQGGIISPMLCNVALNGIEDLVKSQYSRKNDTSPRVNIFRYADDFVITGANPEMLLVLKGVVSDFLKTRGLELSEKKTKITHIRDGFDFLGFNIRRFPFNPRLNQATNQETVLVIQPSKKGIDKLKKTLRQRINKNRPIERIVKDVNPVLRG